MLALPEAPFEKLVCAALRGESPRWPFRDVGSVDVLLEFVARNHVETLLARAVKTLDWPAAIDNKLHTLSNVRAVWELRHQAVISDIIDDLASVGIQPVLFKGTSLAYSLYPDPTLRQRYDTDIIIHPNSVYSADTILRSKSFQHRSGQGTTIANQSSYWLDAGTQIDLHWRVNNSNLLAGILSYDEMLEHAVPLPKFSASARAADPIHALIIACFHRANHSSSHGWNRLAWLYDIHLLAQSLSAEQWSDVVTTAGAKKMKSALNKALTASQSKFDTAVSDAILRELSDPPQYERVSDYVSSGPVRSFWLDLRSLEHHSQKLKFVRDVVFPPRIHMEKKYGMKLSSFSLPFFYTKRAVQGVWDRLNV